MKWILIITMLFSFFACKKDVDNDYMNSNEPKVESIVIDHSIGKDILGNDCIFTYLTFQYLDGYANFGALFSEEFPEPNCKILFYKKENNDYQIDNFFTLDLVIPEANAGKTTNRFPVTHTSFSKYQGLVTIELAYPFQTPCVYNCPGDTVKYSVQIMDRDSLFSAALEKESIFPINL